ncbi:hypothetical protein LPW11_18740 [Geomonas sp. RF6]|uniref:hypothetical protein n=1 Tax=Geomonas sp. RF6 TaxID=2897342 RepID=UPI001E2BB6D3|nr:hypothetical protein [Geomonas sp. RF6]UFS69911.1 hypothetical protein LPW11_18740 [Geomonas sp. RF6]
MTKIARILGLAMTLSLAAAGSALATPSTQIWIPSTDVQPFKVAHLGIDNYFRASATPKMAGNTGTRDANTMDIGATVGVLPFEKIQMEIGFDYLVIASAPNDNHPWSGNFKLGTPEDSLFKGSPALAAGMYNVGPSQRKDIAGGVVAGQNIAYGLVAKTIPAIGAIPSLGRLSAGYFSGSERALVSNAGAPSNDGVLLSWDRTMSEISDKLWLAVDYQGGHSAMGALNIGASWAFAKNVSVIFGYDIYNRKEAAGNNTFTTQLDINFP